MKNKISNLLLITILFIVGLTKVHAVDFYNVEFYPNNGEGNTTQIVQSGQTVNPINPVRQGYELEGWILVSTNEVYDFNTPVISDIQLQARWKLINEENNITNPNTGVTEIVAACILMFTSFGIITYMICKRNV